jgi:hypothetical protein
LVNWLEDQTTNYSKKNPRAAKFKLHNFRGAAMSKARLYDAVEAGRLRPLQPRSTETTTPTTLAEFAREAMLPLIAEPAAH